MNDQNIEKQEPVELSIIVRSWKKTDKYPCPECGKKLGMPDYTCTKCNIKLKPKLQF